MKLEVGNEYEITDYHCMISFLGKYMGEIRDKHNFTQLYLFQQERNGKIFAGDKELRPIGESGSSTSLVGCVVQARVVSNTKEVVPYFYATHYGKTLEDLRHVTHRLEPEWEMVEW